MRSRRGDGMYGAQILVLIAALGSASASTNVVAAGEKVNIDLLNLRLNQIPLANLTIDNVTDILGRPSLSEPYPEDVGAKIHYQDLGLTFWFVPPYMHPSRRLLMLEIYLSKALDPHTKTVFQPFRGKLAPAGGANWKARDTLKAFAAFGPKEQTPEQYERNVREALQKAGSPAEPVTPYYVVTVEVKSPAGRVVFFHEPATTRLTRKFGE